MDKRQVKRISRELTGDERERLARHRQQIAGELPDLEAPTGCARTLAMRARSVASCAAPSMGVTFALAEIAAQTDSVPDRVGSTF